MVMPERLVPGISASAWATPMISAEGSVMFSMVLVCLPTVSAISISTP